MTKAKEKSPATNISAETPAWMKTRQIDINPNRRLIVEYGLLSNHLFMSATLWETGKKDWVRVGLVPVEEVRKHDAQLGRLVDFFGLVKREGRAWIALCRELNLKEG